MKITQGLDFSVRDWSKLKKCAQNADPNAPMNTGIGNIGTPETPQSPQEPLQPSQPSQPEAPMDWDAYHAKNDMHAKKNKEILNDYSYAMEELSELWNKDYDSENQGFIVDHAPGNDGYGYFLTNFSDGTIGVYYPVFDRNMKTQQEIAGWEYVEGSGSEEKDIIKKIWERKNNSEDDVFCSSCGEEDPKISVSDEGIGAYEYAGAPGVDTHYVAGTQCCDAGTTEDKYGEATDVEMPEPDEPDYDRYEDRY